MSKTALGIVPVIRERKTVLHGAADNTRIPLPAHPGMAVMAVKE